MLKEHPKGLLVAFFSNMGERFGFYTMMACLVFYLQARFGMSVETAGDWYSWFYFAIYALALLGGIIADVTKAYKLVIFTGIVTMLGGYILMSVPNMTLAITLTALGIIAFGNGLFKGNLQALVGQMYDDPRYDKLRDSAFSIFYMGINVGAFFAPSAATGMRNWFMGTKGFTYDADLSNLCHGFMQGHLSDTTNLQALADKVSTSPVLDLTTFAHDYISALSTGYNFSFAVAGAAMVVSMIVFAVFKSKLPDKKAEDAKAAAKAAASEVKVVKMPWAEEKQRLIALGLVFIVVIFFWMSFHQNGLTLSMFARDYTVKSVSSITAIFFDIKAFIAFILAIVGLVLILRKTSTKVMRFIGSILFLAGGGVCYWLYSKFSPTGNPIEPEIFQHFNPVFIVALTPLIVGLFAWLRSRNIEPSTPKKIGIGMILAAVGFMIMIAASMGLPSPASLNGQVCPDGERITTYWLIGTYFTLTIAELFLSPMGISFVSKVSPPRFQGLMQGGWLLATALGNKLLFVGSKMWGTLELWQLWLIFVVCCLISATFIFSILKRLEKVTSGQ